MDSEGHDYYKGVAKTLLKLLQELKDNNAIHSFYLVKVEKVLKDTKIY